MRCKVGYLGKDYSELVDRLWVDGIDQVAVESFRVLENKKNLGRTDFYSFKEVFSKYLLRNKCYYQSMYEILCERDDGMC